MILHFFYIAISEKILGQTRDPRELTRTDRQLINDTKGSVNYYANFVSTFFSYFRFWCKMKEMGLFFKRHLKRYHSVHRVVEDTINTVA